jgi:hypothetical protein
MMVLQSLMSNSDRCLHQAAYVGAEGDARSELSIVVERLDAVVMQLERCTKTSFKDC